jgi:hypothetical protein
MKTSRCLLVVPRAVNAVFIARTNAIDARHQAVFGAQLGIPRGIGLYDAAKTASALRDAGPPPSFGFVALVVLTLLITAVLAAVPTRNGGPDQEPHSTGQIPTERSDQPCTAQELREPGPK